MVPPSAAVGTKSHVARHSGRFPYFGMVSLIQQRVINQGQHILKYLSTSQVLSPITANQDNNTNKYM